MKTLKWERNDIAVYTAVTPRHIVAIEVDYVSYMKRLSFQINWNKDEALSQKIGISYTDYAPNKIVERMIERLEIEFNI